MKDNLKGVFNVMPTPFREKGELALQDIDNLVEFLVEKGVNGITVLGVTGEANKLTDAEKHAVVEATLKAVNNRVPVVVGTTAFAPHVVIYHSQNAADAGAAGLMISPPSIAKHNLSAVKKHFQLVSDAVTLPIVLQDFPPESNIFMSGAYMAELADSIERITHIKLEDPPTPPKVRETLKCVRSPIGIFGGLGGTFFLNELQSGAIGTMTGFAFPEVLVEIYKKYSSGDETGAAEVYYRYLPLLNFEGQQGVGLAIRKEILRRRGALTTNALREPASPLPSYLLAQLEDALARVNAPI